MPYKHISVEPLTPTIGATIRDVDLTEPPNNEVFREIHEAWMEHLVIFFRDQSITPEAHLALGRMFGPLHIHPAAPYANDNPELMVIQTDKNSHRNNGNGWHSDVSADKEPPMASILHIHRIPSQGGDTLFSNMYSAFDALSNPMQKFLDGLTAFHSADYTGQYGDHKPQREFPRALHPVVRTHPVTKRKALFVNGGFTKRIEGLAAAESRQLLDFLFEHIKNPNFQCRFHWEEQSIAIWDNRCVQHMAVWDYFPETRSGLRVTVTGDKPFNSNHVQ